jgi:hypothetical protein
MKLVKLGYRVLNLDLLIEARTIPGGKPKLTLVFAGPQPASVGASAWTVESCEVHLEGPAAIAMLEYLDRLIDEDITP